MPELAMPIDKSGYAVARGLDGVLMYRFAIERREFLCQYTNLGAASWYELRVICLPDQLYGNRFPMSAGESSSWGK